MVEPVYSLVHNTWWELLIALYLFLGGLGSMSLVIGYYHHIRHGEYVVGFTGGLLGFILVIVGIGMLIFDLTKPEAFYLVFLSPRVNLASWIVIGSVLLSIFCIASILYAASLAPHVEILPGWLKRFLTKIPILTNEMFSKFIGGVGTIVGFGVAAYTGILIGVCNLAVPLWHPILLPTLFVFSALSTGFGLHELLMGISQRYRKDKAHVMEGLCQGDAVAILLEIAIIIAYFAALRGAGQPAAIEALNELLTGNLMPFFVVGVILVGLIIPLLIILVGEVARGGEGAHPIVPFLTGVFVLIGGALLRYCILEAGMLQVPIIPGG